MMQGTTPTHTFVIPFETSIIDNVRVLYAQNDKVILTKNKEDCTLDDNTIITRLTQEETFLFDNKSPVKIQLRVKTVGGDALITRKYTVSIGKCLDKEVLP